MTSKVTKALVAALLLGGFAGPALAKPKAQAQAAATAPAATRTFNISREAGPGLKALQAAVNAKNYAEVPALYAAAMAKAKTADDKYMAASLWFSAANAQKDSAQTIQAIDAIIASGAATPDDLRQLYLVGGKMRRDANDTVGATAMFEKAVEIAPNDTDALVILATARSKAGRVPEAFKLLEKAIALRTAAGATVDELWFTNAIDMGNIAKVPGVAPIVRAWIQNYPTPLNWRGALRIYQRNSGLPDGEQLEAMRLQRLVKGLTEENDYYRFANILLAKGLPGEAKAVLDEGYASGVLAKASDVVKQVTTLAKTRAAGDQATLKGGAAKALAQATAKPVVNMGDAYYGYGQFADAVKLYTAALTKTGVDRDAVNLKLGMALAASGDKAGATAAFNSVTGVRADLAKLWLIHLSKA